MSWDVALAAAGVETAGAVVQGTLGFGINLLAAPLLVLIDPRFAPGPVVLAGMLGSLLVMRRDWGRIDAKAVGWAVAGRVPGNVAGVVIVVVVAARELRVALGVIVLAGAALSATRSTLRRSKPTLLATGLVSGVMGTVAGLGGAPFGLACQDMDGAPLRGTVAAFALVGSGLSAATLVTAGEIGAQQLRLTLVILPGVAAGFAVSEWLVRRVDGDRLRGGVIGISALSALGEIARALA